MERVCKSVLRTFSVLRGEPPSLEVRSTLIIEDSLAPAWLYHPKWNGFAKEHIIIIIMTIITIIITIITVFHDNRPW